MSSDGTQVSEENSKGWGSNNDFALAANWDPWENLVGDEAPEEAAVPMEFRRVHQQLSHRSKRALVEIGRGANHAKMLQWALKVKERAAAFDLGCLSAKGLIWTYWPSDAPAELQGSLHYLTPAGRDYYEWLSGKPCAKLEFERQKEQTANGSYVKHEGAYIDMVTYFWRRRTHALVQVKPSRYVPGTKMTTRVHPDICIELHSDFDRRLDIQIELGTKRDKNQIRQVAIGTVKSLCSVGRCDVFVRNVGVANRLLYRLKTEMRSLIPMGASIQGPGELRIFPLEKIFNLRNWPYSGDGSLGMFKLSPNGTVTAYRAIGTEVGLKASHQQAA